MFNGFEDAQKLSQENMDLAVKSFSAASKAMQAIAAEMVDYSKRSYEDGAAAIEKLAGVKTFDKAMEVQTDYVKTAYESMVGQATKVGEMYADLAKEVYGPYEGMMKKASK